MTIRDDFPQPGIFRQILDGSDEAITIVDLQGHVIYVNKAFTELSGWAFDEIRGRKLPMTPKTHLAEEEEILARVASGEQVRDHETVKIRKDGSKFWVKANISPLYNDAKEVVAISRITRDISETKTLESTLKASEAQYRTLFEHSREAVYISTPEGKLIDMNPFGLELFGYSLEELRALGITVLYADPADRKRFIKAIETSGFVKDFSVNFRKKSGEVVKTMISAVRLQTALGKTYYQGIIKDVTSLIKLGNELRASLREKEVLLESVKRQEQWLMTTIMSIGDGLIATNPEGKVVFMNPVAEELTGWSNREAAGCDLSIVFPIINEKTRLPVENPASRALKEGMIIGLANHTLLIHRGGREIPIADSAAPITDSEGNVIGVVLVFRDMTAKRKAEVELVKMERRYRDLFRKAPVMYVLVRDEGGLPYLEDCSESFLNALGYSKEELSAVPLTDFYTPESREKALGGGFRRSLQEEVVQERSFVTRDGRLVHTILHASPERDEEGRTTGVRAIYTDITELREVQTRLKASEEELRGMFSALDDRVMVVDKEGRYLKIAPTSRQKFYRPPEEMVGKTYHDIFPKEKADFFLSKVTEALKTGRRVECSYQLPTLEGMERWFGATVSPLEKDKVIWIARDITDLKSAEEKKETLEEQVQQLAKLEAIGRLAGGVAHDFNNIIQAISGYVEIMRIKLRPEDPLHTEVAEIGKAAARAANLTRQLLAFGRKSIMKMEVINLNGLVGDMERMLKRLIGEDIELITYLSEPLPKVKVDAGQFEHVIINLAVNARDAMPRGGKLTIETGVAYLDEEYVRNHQGATVGNHVLLSVSDTGVGMTPEVKARLFEPFFTTKEKGKGTGLGLASIYGIVKQSGGNIWVYSEINQGTTFKIYLPVVEEEVREGRKSFRQDVMKGTETILIVEDDEHVRKLASLFLRELGYHVLEASHPDEALLIGERFTETIHLVLTDVVLPAINGRELTERLRQIRQDFKVLFMSGYTDNVIVHHGVLGPEVSFIQKPFNLLDLSLKVREVLAKE